MWSKIWKVLLVLIAVLVVSVSVVSAGGVWLKLWNITSGNNCANDLSTDGRMCSSFTSTNVEMVQNNSEVTVTVGALNLDFGTGTQLAQIFILMDNPIIVPTNLKCGYASGKGVLEIPANAIGFKELTNGETYTYTVKIPEGKHTLYVYLWQKDCTNCPLASYAEFEGEGKPECKPTGRSVCVFGGNFNCSLVFDPDLPINQFRNTKVVDGRTVPTNWFGTPYQVETCVEFSCTPREFNWDNTVTCFPECKMPDGTLTGGKWYDTSCGSLVCTEDIQDTVVP